MTPDSVLEGSLRTSSGSSGSGGAAGGVGCRTLACTATTEIVRKKRSSISTFRAACQPNCSPVSEISVGMMNRRKGTPAAVSALLIYVLMCSDDGEMKRVMSTGDLLNIQPGELKFPFELRKQSSCSMQLTNKTDQHVAFKVKTTNPKKYCVRPNTGIVLPGSACNVTVTMQAQKEAPPDMQCKDKFLLQSVVAPYGTTSKDITPEMFNKVDGKVIEEFKLRVVYIPANPPSPVPEGSEEGSPPRASVVEDGNQNASSPDAVTRTFEEAEEKSSSAEVRSMISKLTEAKASIDQQNQKLRQELELMRREISKSRGGGFSFLFVVLIGVLGNLLEQFHCIVKLTSGHPVLKLI
ncbi:hypothetical protein F0562_014747 [Nyssa sinensis]|uniref:MSP domain-containing protein n=1 Tax=Nyssa sinensis TaxID=561372 RepID=A0A5J4ZTQ9_9ASTE|nr:hypothetical protein F0562_014747 [Nyssa sinensis]